MAIKQLFKPALLAALMVGSLSAQAHRAWILPDVTVLSGKTPTVTFDAAVSNGIFNFDHVPMRPEAFSITAPDGSNVEALNPHVGRFRSVFDVKLEQEGTYRVFMAAHGLRATWVGEDGKRQMWPGRGQAFTQEGFDKNVPKKAKDLTVTQTSRRVETFVTNKAPSDNAFKVTNQGLELLPITHPNDLYAGEPAKFSFLIDGKPAKGVEVTLVREGTRYRNSPEEITLVSDNKGEISIEWNGAGRYFVEAEYKDNQAKKPATSRMGAYVAVLEVLPD